jgi:phage gp36-like protein
MHFSPLVQRALLGLTYPFRTYMQLIVVHCCTVARVRLELQKGGEVFSPPGVKQLHLWG